MLKFLTYKIGEGPAPYSDEVAKHMGPGPHPSGTDQDVHGDGGGRRVVPTGDELSQLGSDIAEHAAARPQIADFEGPDGRDWDAYEQAGEAWEAAHPGIDFKYRKPNKRQYPGYMEMMSGDDAEGDVWNDVGKELFYADEAKWELAVERSLTLGHIDIETAKEIGWYESVGGQVNRGGLLEPAWSELPDTLYHVTMAKDGVLGAGRLKTRQELAIEFDEPGLGGGPSDTVSYTTDRNLALDIEEVMREAQDVATGNVSVQDMLDDAAAGTGADQPYLRGIISSFAGSHLDKYDWENGEYPPNLTWLLEGRKVDRKATGWKYQDEEGSLKNPIPEGWEPVESSRIEGATVDVWWEIQRPLTGDELRRETWNMYRNKFLGYRERAGGLFDPYIAHDNWEAVAAVDPSQIATFEFAAQEGAMGYQAGALAEWRAFSGVGVDIVGEVFDD